MGRSLRVSYAIRTDCPDEGPSPRVRERSVASVLRADNWAVEAWTRAAEKSADELKWVEPGSAPEGAGDTWTWTALDADAKLIISVMSGRLTTCAGFDRVTCAEASERCGAPIFADASCPLIRLNYHVEQFS